MGPEIDLGQTYVLEAQILVLTSQLKFSAICHLSCMTSA